MDKYEAEFDPNVGDKGWQKFAKDSVFTRKVHENRISREKFKESRQNPEKTQKFYTQEELEEYEEAVLYDKHTGLLSQKTFERKFKYELKRARRYKRPLSLLLLTIDEIELIGRQYGELCVDDCFKRVAEIISGMVRDVDMPARSQSNQIAIIFPETYSSRATIVGERICEKIKEEPINEQLRFMRVTASIGIVSFPTHARDDIDLMNKAKEFLAVAQESGGDKVYNG